MTSPPLVSHPFTGSLAELRRAHTRRRQLRLALATVGLLALVILSLTVGRTVYSPAEVWAVITGHSAGGATFTVGQLRLPRTALACIAGACFGFGGVAFQTLLRNPLASPDIIGISSGASAGAAFAIILFGLSGVRVSVVAITAGLAVALIIYVLAFRDGVSNTRLVLIGIGIAAMLNAAIAYALEQAPQWELQTAMRWLTGSLNGAQWSEVLPTLIALLCFGTVLLSQSRNLANLQLGDDTAAALGVRTERTRVLLIVAAVALVAFATAATGPIAFVAFLAGPIATRLFGAGRSPFVPAALVGALLVLAADFIGQYAFGTRYPVGVITGVLGAPYLIYLIIRSNTSGGAA